MSRRGRLILVEGLPGAGKSTTSHVLCLHLESLGIPARWWYEHDTSHPVFDYEAIADVLDRGILREGLFEQAIGNWRRLADGIAAGGGFAILESSFFQTPLHPMLLLDRDEARIARYVLAVAEAIGVASPLLVTLNDVEAETALAEVTARRGADFAAFLERRIANSAYGRRLGLAGHGGAVSYFEAYRALIHGLRAQLGMETLDLAGPKEAYLGRIAAALGLPPPAADGARRDHAGLAGRYRDLRSDDVYEIVAEPDGLYVDGAPRVPLLHKGGLAFALRGTCVTLEFQLDRDGIARALSCRGDLPGLAPDWVRAP